MKFKNIKQLAYMTAALCLGGAAVSCSDSFLESDPILSDTAETFYSDDAQMFNALIAAYDVLQWQSGAPLGNPVPFGEIRSDNCRTGGGGPGDQPDMQDIEEFKNDNVCSVADGIWKRDYTAIYRANLVINAEYTSDMAEVYKAEALVLRAWHHFDLLRTYGPCVISLETVYPTGAEFTRSTREEVNKQIESDLLAAIPHLIKKHEDAYVGRITQATAQAILGKVYLYWADWNNDDQALFDKAATQFEAVMASGNYTLMNDYKAIFAPHAENNSESIFEIQRSTKSGWTNWGTSQHSEGNFWENFAGPRGMSGNHPDFYPGWGFMLPTQELADYFLPDDVARKDAALLTSDEVVVDGTNGSLVTWNLDAYGPDWDGQAQGKYLMWKDYEIIGGRPLNNAGNERLIRYGEIYLLLAECYLRGTKGSEGQAKELINTLRQAHVAGGAADFDKVDDLIAKYPSRFSTTLDVLWYERRVELACEGDRWFDLVRSGRAKAIFSAMYPDWNDNDIYMPIGSVEVSNSGGSLKPYPEETYSY